MVFTLTCQAVDSSPLSSARIPDLRGMLVAQFIFREGPEQDPGIGSAKRFCYCRTSLVVAEVVMATRDKSQGFGFMYVDITRLLAQRDELKKNEDAPVTTAGHQTINFNRDREPLRVVSNPADRAPVATPTDSVRERSQAIHQIRENLDRLQSLHHKLHAMLEELNGITADKKK
jgi:hypothetical protein